MEEDTVENVQEILTYIISSLLVELRRDSYVWNTAQPRRKKRDFLWNHYKVNYLENSGTGS